MSFKSNQTHVESQMFSELTHISHGFSYKSQGDMRDDAKLLQFQETIRVSDPFFQPQQVHSDTIVINPRHLLSVEGDGVLIIRDQSPIQTVGVLTADCVPILFTDTHTKCIGAVHSGWKGTLANIATTMLQHICSYGIDASAIRVCIGPHIGSCCYTVSEDRIHAFKKVYSNYWEYAYETNGMWHLDLGRIILKQLDQYGLNSSQVDTGIFCTCCQSESFFSYRRDTKESFGEMIALVGFI